MASVRLELGCAASGGATVRSGTGFVGWASLADDLSSDLLRESWAISEASDSGIVGVCIVGIWNWVGLGCSAPMRRSTPWLVYWWRPLKSEIRSPKSETNPKSESRDGCERRSFGLRISGFGLRTSDFGRQGSATVIEWSSVNEFHVYWMDRRGTGGTHDSHGSAFRPVGFE